MHNELQMNYCEPSAPGSSPGLTTLPQSELPGVSISSTEPSSSKIINSQETAIALMQSGRNVFLTGMAGTGKSHTLIEFLGGSFRRVDACATTGIAALNLQDQFMRRAGVALAARTIYSWAGMGLGPAPGQKAEVYFKWLEGNKSRSRVNAWARVMKAQTLVIDEISMLPGRILDYLDYHCRMIRDDARPFGGIQLIVVGDFCQLPPVSKIGVYDWAFQCTAWQRARFHVAYLTRIYRQDDPVFVEALNCFRMGSVSRTVADVLSARVKRFVDRKVVRLMTHNAQVDKWNTWQIEEIDSPAKVYEAGFSGPDHEAEFLRKNVVTPDRLTLKRGARVMVTANISQEGKIVAVNGQCGSVERMEDCAVTIRTDEGDEVELDVRTWQFDPQREDSAKMQQIPLRPAYAMTIHKCQGLTLDRAHIDIRAAREPGQAYVALSRLRGLGGLYLKDWIKGVHVSDAAINFYRKLL